MSTSNPIASRAHQADSVGTALVEYLGDLTEADWLRPSDCEGWNVSDVVAHLVLVEALLGGSISRGLEGDVAPLPQAVGGPNAWRDYRAREIARLSGLPRADLVSQFESGLGAMRDALARLAAADPHPGGGWHPTAGVRPLAWFAGQWLVEMALHDWDIRVSGDPNADVHSAALPSLGPEMRDRMQQCFKPELGGDLRGTVRVTLGNPAPLSWSARVSDGTIELAEDSEPNATIETDAGSYALVQTNRRPADFFTDRGRWRVSGDAMLADRLTAAFSGY